jgi:hypothetical protein
MRIKKNGAQKSDLLDCITIFPKIDTITNIIRVFDEQEYDRREHLGQRAANEPRKAKD